MKTSLLTLVDGLKGQVVVRGTPTTPIVKKIVLKSYQWGLPYFMGEVGYTITAPGLAEVRDLRGERIRLAAYLP